MNYFVCRTIAFNAPYLFLFVEELLGLQKLRRKPNKYSVCRLFLSIFASTRGFGVLPSASYLATDYSISGLSSTVPHSRQFDELFTEIIVLFGNMQSLIALRYYMVCISENLSKK